MGPTTVTRRKARGVIWAAVQSSPARSPEGDRQDICAAPLGRRSSASLLLTSRIATHMRGKARTRPKTKDPRGSARRISRRTSTSGRRDVAVRTTDQVHPWMVGRRARGPGGGTPRHQDCPYRGALGEPPLEALVAHPPNCKVCLECLGEWTTRRGWL